VNKRTLPVLPGELPNEACVHRLQYRRRETGSIAPRRQTRWRTRSSAAQTQLETLIQANPAQTLAELQAALETPECVGSVLSRKRK
jgi:CRISPR/Cas system-associated protein Csm6